MGHGYCGAGRFNRNLGAGTGGRCVLTREIITLKRTKLRHQLDELNRVMRQYNVVACNLDQTGMGEKMVEDAQYQHGEQRVQGVLFNVVTKLNMATLGKMPLKTNKFVSRKDSDLRADLHKLKKLQAQRDNHALWQKVIAGTRRPYVGVFYGLACG